MDLPATSAARELVVVDGVGRELTANVAEPGSKPTGLIAQMSRFGLAGGLSGVIDYGSVLLCVALGMWPELARALGFAVGSTMAYLLNRRWTFNSRRSVGEVGLVAVIYALTFGIVVVVNALVLHFMPAAWWLVTLAWIVSQGVATTFNFAAQRVLVFQRRA